MITVQSIVLSIGKIFMVMFWLTWWFKLLVVGVVSLTAVIFHYVKLNKVKGEKADTERKLVETNELLLYSSRNEQKANNKALQEESNKGKLLSKLNH
ncbi:MAG: hypothetical protein ABIS01_07365, partial [Ferruginibacter sp.]